MSDGGRIPGPISANDDTVAEWMRQHREEKGWNDRPAGKRFTTTEVNYIVAAAPGTGHCRINEFGWHGCLGLDDARYEEYLMAVCTRDAEQSLKAAARYLEERGWMLSWAWIGVHGD